MCFQLCMGSRTGGLAQDADRRVSEMGGGSCLCACGE